MEQSWFIFTLLGAQRDLYLSALFNLHVFPGASYVAFSLRRMTRQWFERFLVICQHRATGLANIFHHDLTGIAKLSILSSSKKVFVLVLKLNNYVVHFMSFRGPCRNPYFDTAAEPGQQERFREGGR